MKIRTEHIWTTTIGLILGASCGETTTFEQIEQPSVQSNTGNADSVVGDKVILGPNGERIVIHPDGSQTITNPDGTVTIIGPDGQILVSDARLPGSEKTLGDRRDNDLKEDYDTSVGGNSDPEPEKTIAFSQSFPIAELLDAESSLNYSTEKLTTVFTMDRSYAAKSVTKKQITRPRVTDKFEQGNLGSTFLENFEQIANRTLDILVVIDDSHSMKQEQDNLAGKLSPLLEYIKEADWQIAVTLTDPNKACLRSLIKKSDKDAESAFASAVTAGITGDNNERGILTAVRALSGQCVNNGDWLRPDSTLAVLIVSDEDNCSDGTGCSGKAYAKSEYLLNQLEVIRQPKLNARVYGIFWHPDETRDQCSTGYHKANIWNELVEQTLGTWGSICDDDYSATLRSISRNIQATLNSRFTLRQIPTPGSVKIFVNNVLKSNGYDIIGKVVQLNPPPPEGAKISISYKYGATPMKTSFPLSYAPLDGSLEVTINSVKLAPDRYKFDSQTQTIIFSPAPNERDQISAQYTRNIPLLTQFALGERVKSDSLLLSINGVKTTDFSLSASTGIVSFVTPPAEGATLQFDYTSVGDPNLSFPLKTDGAPPRNLEVRDFATDIIIAATWVNGSLVFQNTDFVEGRKIKAIYDYLGNDDNKIILGVKPIPSSISAKSSSMSCNGSDKFVVTDREVNISKCNFPDEAEIVTLNYKYVMRSFSEFAFSATSLPDPSTWQRWQVYVGQTERSDWSRQGNVIKFNAPLPLDGVVRIVLTIEDQ